MLASSSLVRYRERTLAALVSGRLAAASAAVAAVLFWVAYDGGSYATTAWTSLAIVAWWGVGVLVVFDLAPTERLRSGTGIVAALLAAYAGFALASAAWSPGAERAVVVFDRDALYVGVFLLVVLLSSSRTLAAWSDGLALATAVIAVVALASRLFPGLFGARGLPASLPIAGLRLAFPLEYWNGLGIFLAIGLPLLLRTSASAARPLAVRAIAVAAVPVSAAAIYLTSSRGAVATAVVGLVLLVLLAGTWTPLAAALAASAGSAAAVLAVRAEHAVTGGPLGSAAAVAEGRTAAYVVAAIAVVTGAAFAGGVFALAGRRTPGRRTAIGVAVLAVMVIAAAAAASDPAQKLRDFQALPAPGMTVIGAHLASGSGSGRWQFWTAAVDEFRSAPLAGRGAGSFEAWWTQHASFPYFIRDAHSLYLQTLGELGIVGLLLLVAAFGTGLTIGVRALRGRRGEERLASAAVIGAFAAYLVAAGIDWMWELPAVTVLGIGCLGLVAGPAARPRLALAASSARKGSFRGRFGMGVVVLLATWFALAVEASSLLAASQLDRSQQLAARGDLAGALAAANNAHQIAPWSSQPLVQVALVQETGRRFGAAEAAIARAIGHDSRDWRLWLIRARIESQQGHEAPARASLARARRLNPLSPLLRR